MSVWQSLFNTAAELYEPHNWWGLAGLIVIGLPTTIGATFAGLNWLRGRGTRVELDRYFAGVHERLDGHAFAIETLTNRVETLHCPPDYYPRCHPVHRRAPTQPDTRQS